MTDKQFPLHISAVDIGTNTIKVTHARVDADGTIETLAEVAETIRLGKGIEESGRISDDRVAACLDVLREQESLGRRLGSTAFAGVATETLRVAANGAGLLRKMREETAWDIRVITGEDEARLTWLGLRDQIPVTGVVLIVDIGGGSTEIIRVENESVISSISIPLGSGRLADRFFESDPPGRDAVDAAADRAGDELDAVPDLPPDADAIVLAGGNGVFIDQLARQLMPGRPLSQEIVTALLEHLATTPASDTAGRIGIALERARVLPAGVAIALAMLARVPATAVSAAPSGIRTGLIRDIVALRH